MLGIEEGYAEIDDLKSRLARSEELRQQARALEEEAAALLSAPPLPRSRSQSRSGSNQASPSAALNPALWQSKLEHIDGRDSRAASSSEMDEMDSVRVHVPQPAAPPVSEGNLGAISEPRAHSSVFAYFGEDRGIHSQVLADALQDAGSEDGGAGKPRHDSPGGSGGKPRAKWQRPSAVAGLDFDPLDFGSGITSPDYGASAEQSSGRLAANPTPVSHMSSSRSLHEAGKRASGVAGQVASVSPMSPKGGLRRRPLLGQRPEAASSSPGVALKTQRGSLLGVQERQDKAPDTVLLPEMPDAPLFAETSEREAGASPPRSPLDARVPHVPIAPMGFSPPRSPTADPARPVSIASSPPPVGIAGSPAAAASASRALPRPAPAPNADAETRMDAIYLAARALIEQSVPRGQQRATHGANGSQAAAEAACGEEAEGKDAATEQALSLLDSIRATLRQAECRPAAADPSPAGALQLEHEHMLEHERGRLRERAGRDSDDGAVIQRKSLGAAPAAFVTLAERCSPPPPCAALLVLPPAVAHALSCSLALSPSRPLALSRALGAWLR